jgi:hypothetical protein
LTLSYEINLVSVLSLDDNFLSCGNSFLIHVVDEELFLLFTEMVEKERVHKEEENFHLSCFVFGKVSLSEGDLTAFVKRTVDFRADGGSDFASGVGDFLEPPSLELFVRDIFEDIIVIAIV